MCALTVFSEMPRRRPIALFESPCVRQPSTSPWRAVSPPSGGRPVAAQVAPSRSQQGGHEGLAAQHQPQRRQQRLCAGGLGHIAERAPLEGLAHVVGIVGRGQHDDRNVGTPPRELGDRGHAARAGHRQVEEHRVQIGVPGRELEAGRGVFGFEHHGARVVVRQQRGDALAHEGLIINDEKLHRRAPLAWS